jgi:hypothetical protein
MGAGPKLREGYSGMLVARGHAAGRQYAGNGNNGTAFPHRSTQPSERL